MLPINLVELARTGVNIEITANEVLPINLDEVIRTVANFGGHITIDIHGRLPMNFMELALIGRSSLTFRW